MENSFNEKIATIADFDVTHRLRAALVWARVHTAELICAGILIVMGWQLLAVISRKSLTVDELVLIPAGYYHLVTSDRSLVREHPPLCKFLSGFPVLLIQPNELQPAQTDREMKKVDLDLKYEMRFWEDNRSRADTIAFWARVPMIMFALGLGVLIFIFTRDFFGKWAAVFAVALFSLEPTVLAHARVVQTDIPATFGLLLTILTLQRYLRDRTLKLAAGVGLASAIAMLAKFSMIIIVPILVIVCIALLWSERQDRWSIFAHALMAALVLLIVVNAAYFFHRSPITDGDQQWVIDSFPKSHDWVLSSVRLLRFLVPTDFLLGVYWQLHHTNQGHPTSLLGMHGRMGWWYYYPVAFALKTTLPFLLLSVTTLGWALYKLIKKTEWRLLFLLIPFGLYTVFLMMSPIAIGVRYYLPAFPFLFVLCGGMFDVLKQKWRQNGVPIVSILVVVIAFGWLLVEAFRAYPNHVTYMNQLASSRPHWWYLSDSNVEWGDDLKELASYLHARGETRVTTMALGDFLTLSFYGIERLNALGPVPQPTPRFVALGASFLNGSTVPEVIEDKYLSEEERINFFARFRQRTPEAVIGNSIYVYRAID